MLWACFTYICYFKCATFSSETCFILQKQGHDPIVLVLENNSRVFFLFHRKSDYFSVKSVSKSNVTSEPTAFRGRSLAHYEWENKNCICFTFNAGVARLGVHELWSCVVLQEPTVREWWKRWWEYLQNATNAFTSEFLCKLSRAKILASNRSLLKFAIYLGCRVNRCYA